MNKLMPSSTPSKMESFTGRKKVLLAPGHSLMDWIRLGRSEGDLSGVGNNKLQVTAAELAMHNTQKDIWMCIRGKVYNLTPYLDYHPGGVEELMRAAGKDGTDLFDEIHNWVNAESMLEKCFVGTLSDSAKAPVRISKVRQLSVSSISSSKPIPQNPTQDWYQNDKEVVIAIYTRWKEMKQEFVIVDISATEIMVETLIKDFSYFVHIHPICPVTDNCRVEVTANGKVEVFFEKANVKENWNYLGTSLKFNDAFIKSKCGDCKYRQWTVVSNQGVTHDTRLICLKAPAGCRMIVPIGYHLHIRADISGMEIGRSFTVVLPSLTKPFSDADALKGKSLYLMVKNYPGGALSPWLCSLKSGDKVDMSNFDGDFDFSVLEKTTYLTMFAAGTGFTSMIRLIAHALFTLKDKKYPVKLMFFNKAQKDILWSDQLQELEKMFPSRFSVTHVLSQETDLSWKGLRGRVSGDHVKKCVLEMKTTPNPLFCICGQWAYNDVVESLAKLNGLTEENIYVFTQRI
ncbi:cytochrome b5 reductase 4-like isoform X2 [Physella acuta]|uniref:cytochrome b5 reductase 4-like isoform X2 n=1 Tax=Physella acuta TaxID=109671 RepID=UPI0027DC1F65|nr:cytochrome b5 reductase 4-like isoform X2 [Physella acuta]